MVYSRSICLWFMALLPSFAVERRREEAQPPSSTKLFKAQLMLGQGVRKLTLNSHETARKYISGSARHSGTGWMAPTM